MGVGAAEIPERTLEAAAEPLTHFVAFDQYAFAHLRQAIESSGEGTVGGASAIDLTAMADPHHQDHQLAAVPFVDHAVVTHPQAPQSLEFTLEGALEEAVIPAVVMWPPADFVCNDFVRWLATGRRGERRGCSPCGAWWRRCCWGAAASRFVPAGQLGDSGGSAPEHRLA